MVPNATLAAFVPAQVNETPAASFSNVRLIELATVPVTVNVPDEVCAAANRGRAISAPTRKSESLAVLIMTSRPLQREWVVHTYSLIGKATRRCRKTIQARFFRRV